MLEIEHKNTFNKFLYYTRVLNKGRISMYTFNIPKTVKLKHATNRLSQNNNLKYLISMISKITYK